MKKPLVFLLLFTLLIVAASFFFQLNEVTGRYMEPALSDGAKVVSRRFIFGEKRISRGDIILFRREGTNNDFIGRVVGLPKEQVRVQKGILYIDTNAGQWKVTEEYLPTGLFLRAFPEGEWIRLGEFEYFILGDKRDREFGIKENFTQQDMIVGKMLFSF